ncbi:hypothetical protein C499_13980 [Halogeometricum borinquense DSM 11551]|uniref:Uncharacterized protein n=2 Tax=Halogeometricum borinquense TaxID=60847 RepID=E4NU11_HALBP|nr:hypothetical protein [Halogeometricum borinquense]ADQ68531.1 hypothetical protein Hbor_29940 [Halogeometricum borinquense DSM 11551]ELY25597.1 hypothetical protein C499_13980 [Halogeometricum borinquense DSM 11551]RYJ08528.1 hypothetical protein ELS19_18650 [Halogeometricum borinquense]
MSSNPIETTFDLQHQSVKQAREIVEQNVKLQQSMMQSVPDGMDAQRSVQHRASDLSKQALHTYAEAIEAASPEAEMSFEDMHQAIDDGFDMFNESLDDMWDYYEQIVDMNVEAYDEFADTQLNFVHDSFDAFLESYEAVEEQTIEITNPEMHPED